MMSRLVTRTVLVSIISAMIWALGWWTWTAEFKNINQRIVMTVIESSVLLAALSLLFESFRSFGIIAIKRRSWGYFLSGLCLLDNDRNVSNINTRTCALFGVRSVILSIFSIITMMFITIIYQISKATVLFLLNPYIPVINWSETLWFVGSLVVAIPVALLFMAGWASINKKVANRVVMILVSTLYWSLVFGLVIGTISIFEPSGFENMPVYLIMLMGTGVALIIASLAGIIFGLAYAIYGFVGLISQRFPVLGDVWNQLCPVQEVRFQ